MSGWPGPRLCRAYHYLDRFAVPVGIEIHRFSHIPQHDILGSSNGVGRHGHLHAVHIDRLDTQCGGVGRSPQQSKHPMEKKRGENEAYCTLEQPPFYPAALFFGDTGVIRTSLWRAKLPCVSECRFPDYSVVIFSTAPRSGCHTVPTDVDLLIWVSYHLSVPAVWKADRHPLHRTAGGWDRPV